jgi:hypothetical protein
MDLMCEYCFGQKTEVRMTSWVVRFRLENNVAGTMVSYDSVLGSSVTSEKLNSLSS